MKWNLRKWNWRAKFYDVVFSLPLIRGGREKEISCFTELLEEAKKAEKFSNSGEKTTLDVGCGSGEFLSFHSSFARSSFAIGLDISEEMLKKARGKKAGGKNGMEKKRNNSFVLGSALALPFKSNVFDFASSIGLSEYFENENAFFAELSKVIKQNSYGIISYTPKSMFNLFRKLWGIRFFERDEEEIRKAAEESGFEVVERRSTRMQVQLLLKKVK